MNLLVTGGLGFIGSALVSMLSRQRHRVVVYDLPSSAPRVPDDRNQPGVTVVCGDVLDSDLLTAVLRREQTQRVVHAAAVAGIVASMRAPRRTAEINILGSLGVLEAAGAAGVERVVDLSSEEIYGPLQYEPVDEDHPANPVNPYAITKYCAEQFGRYISQHASLEYVAVRLCWVYGPGYPRARLPRTFLRDAVAGRKTVLRQGADHRLDLTYIDDAVAGLGLVATAARLAHQAYNIASGTAHPVTAVAAAVKSLVPSWEFAIGSGPLQLEQSYTLAPKGPLDITRARRELGYHPRWSLIDGLMAELADVRQEPQAG